MSFTTQAACIRPHFQLLARDQAARNRALDRIVQRGDFGAQRLRRHVITMLGCLADGIRQHVGLGTFNADLGQLTGDGE